MPGIRARLVACEVATKKNGVVFASTPPLEAKRLRFSESACKRKTPDGRKLELTFVDINKAYFNGAPKRKLHLFVPREMGQGPKAIAHLKRSVYDTRDAGMIWEECYSQAPLPMGFRRGVASPCCVFQQRQRRLRCDTRRRLYRSCCSLRSHAVRK